MLHSMGDIGRVLRAAGYSVAGLRAALRKEAAFRQEVILFVVLAPLAFWLGRNGIERALLLGSLLLVLIVELLNSAVEATVDRISKKHHRLSGRAKDMGSAAVYLSLLLAALTWLLVLADGGASS
ncbi:MAG: diacylglycerol kinase [Candidatus Muproteobacteria bacterium RBG_16_64_10]|uniref:Diacylglycerol kinase n=1 Tax=Candidatus Muproteobacteria bacterium RBG_16_64_10 TaxID=1817757 RepID=A0A1F6T0C3_9PROT|nr:MAG: diacylglycerol kinase [Candidatus Muproteobacteria bacterium RBG_16_64_10]